MFDSSRRSSLFHQRKAKDPRDFKSRKQRDRNVSILFQYVFCETDSNLVCGSVHQHESYGFIDTRTPGIPAEHMHTFLGPFSRSWCHVTFCSGCSNRVCDLAYLRVSPLCLCLPERLRAQGATVPTLAQPPSCLTFCLLVCETRNFQVTHQRFLSSRSFNAGRYLLASNFTEPLPKTTDVKKNGPSISFVRNVFLVCVLAPCILLRCETLQQKHFFCFGMSHDSTQNGSEKATRTLKGLCFRCIYDRVLIMLSTESPIYTHVHSISNSGGMHVAQYFGLMLTWLS